MLKVTVVGAEELRARLGKMPDEVQGELKAAVAQESTNLAQYIVREKLQGQVLRHVSGKLGQSVTDRPVTVEDGVVWGGAIQSGNVKYGAVHEHGFVGDELVRAHTRTVVFGRLVKKFDVGEFTRHMRIPARPFMAPSLDDRAETIQRTLLAAIKRGMKKASAAG